MRFWVTFTAIVVGGAILRLGSPSPEHACPGLGTSCVHPDETIPVAVAKHMAATDSWDTNWKHATSMPALFKYDQYNFSSYIVAGYALSRIAMQRLSAAMPDEQVQVAYRRFSAVLGSLTVALTGVLGCMLCGRPQALIAMALAAVSVGLYHDSLYARPETFVTVMSLLFAMTLARIRSQPAALLVASGLLLGVLVAAKITFLALLPLPLMLVAARACSVAAPPPAVSGAVLAYFGAIALGFFLTAPHAVLRPWEYLRGVAYLLEHYAGLPPHGSGAGYLLDTAGPVVLGFAALGVGSLVRGGTLEASAIVGAFLCFIVYFLRSWFGARNITHALPFLYLAAAQGILATVHRLLPARWQTAAAVALSAVALIPAIRLDAAIRGDVLGGGFHRRLRAQGATLEQAKRTPVLDLNSRLGDAYTLMRSLGTNLDGPLLFSVLDLDPVLREVDLAHHDAAVTRTSTVEMQRELGLQEVARVPGPLAGLAGSWLSPFNNTLTAYVLDVVFLERPDDGERHRWRITPILFEDISGRPLDVPIARDPPWQANGTPPDAVAPDGIDAYGSWSRAGTQTGRLQLGPFAAHGDLLLAYTTGRDASGLRLEFLLRRDDGPEERRLLTMFGSPGRWIGLRVTPALGHGGELTIVATDEGTGHDQWMALGLPLRVEPRVRLPGDP